MKFDVLVCIDCWGNLPDVIAKNILDVDIKDKILVNSTGKNIHNDLQHLELNNDIKQFVKKYGQIKSVENRIANVLLAGQGWPCGTHDELIGIKSLTLFVPNRLKIFVDTKLIALSKFGVKKKGRAKVLDRYTAGHRHLRKHKKLYGAGLGGAVAWDILDRDD